MSPQSDENPFGKLDFEKLVNDARTELRKAVSEGRAEKPSMREPSADARAFGMQMMNFFCGFVGAGFNEQQALGLVSQIISASILANARKPE